MSKGQKKPPQTARDRLAQISHHFLSDDEGSAEEESVEQECAEESEQVQKNDVYTVALLKTANDDDELPVFLLSQQLAMRGHSATILDCATGMNMVSFMNDSQQTRTVHHGLHHHTLEDVTRQLGDKPHDVHFLLVDTPESSHLSLADKVLVTAPATPEGLQRTYISIKQLASHHNEAQVGVTITGVSDVSRAEYCFNRLETAIHQFLGRNLLNYGYLQAPSSISRQTKAPHPALISHTRSGIAMIAEIISNEISECEQNNVRDDRQKKQPINPAPTKVLLS